MITTIGKHKVQHGDVRNGIDLLMGDETADLFYSDPPWGVGNLKFWQTKNLKDTGTPRTDQDLDDFLSHIFRIASRYTKRVVMIEYGIRWRDEIIKRGEAVNLKHLDVIGLRYKSGKGLLPLDLHVFSPSGGISALPRDYESQVRDTYGFDTLKKAVGPLCIKGDTILDPCCGMGYTARAALENGMTFRGNELNAVRLQKTINLLEKGER